MACTLVELAATLDGDEFRRYTHDDVTEEPRLMLAEHHALLQSVRPA